MKVELINAWDAFDDDNGGLTYGLQEVGPDISYCEWFATEAERDAVIKEENMEVVN